MVITKDKDGVYGICCSMDDAYTKVYNFLNNCSSYKNVAENFPWDYFCIDNDDERSEFEKLFADYIEYE